MSPSIKGIAAIHLPNSKVDCFLPDHHALFCWKGYNGVSGFCLYWSINDLQDGSTAFVVVPVDIHRQVAVLFAVMLQDLDEVIYSHSGYVGSRQLWSGNNLIMEKHPKDDGVFLKAQRLT